MVEYKKWIKELNVRNYTVLIRDAGILDFPGWFVGWFIDFLLFQQLQMFTE